MGLIRLLGALNLNASGWHTAMDRAEKHGNAMGKRLGASLRNHLAGYFGARAIAHETKQTIEYGSKIQDLSKSLQVSTRSLQEQDFALTQNGGSMEDLVVGYRSLAKAKETALGGDRKKMSLFEALGISPEALKSQNLETLFKGVAEGFRTKKFGGDEFGMATELLGRAAEHLLPAFKAGLQEAADEANRLGVILGDDVIASLDRTGDELDKLTKRIRGPLAGAIGFVAPMIRRLIDELDVVFGGLGAFIGGFIYTEGSLLDKLKGASQAGGDHVRGVSERRKATEHVSASADADKRAEAELQRAKSQAEQEEAKKVLRLRDQIAEIQRRTQMRGMTDAEKEAQVTKEILGLRAQIDAMKGQGKSESEILEKEKDLAERQGELAQIQDAMENAKSGGSSDRIAPMDALARIGGLTQHANAYNPMTAPLERIAKATESTAENTGKQFDIGL